MSDDLSVQVGGNHYKDLVISYNSTNPMAWDRLNSVLYMLAQITARKPSVKRVTLPTGEFDYRITVSRNSHWVRFHRPYVYTSLRELYRDFKLYSKIVGACKPSTRCIFYIDSQFTVGTDVGIFDVLRETAAEAGVPISISSHRIGGLLQLICEQSAPLRSKRESKKNTMLSRLLKFVRGVISK